MGGDGGSGFGRLMRFAGLALGCIALANCSGGSGRIDPKYGVSASARVVEPGQEVPKGGGVYRVGKPYMIAGREYVPQEDVNYNATGMASWYGDDFHGRYTANGEIFDMQSLTAAHPTLPLPSYVRVTNLTNHKSVVVRVNDRGPYVGNRLIDVSVRTAKLLGFYGQGLTRVKVEYVGRAPLEGSDDRKLEATLREVASELLFQRRHPIDRRILLHATHGRSKCLGHCQGVVRRGSYEKVHARGRILRERLEHLRRRQNSDSPASLQR